MATAALKPQKPAAHLYSEGIVMAGESQQEFDALLDSYLTYYVPTNEREHSLVVEVAAARWRLHRAFRTETLLFDTEIARLLNEPGTTITPGAARAIAFTNLTRRGGPLNHLHREEANLRRAYDKAHAELLDAALVNAEMEAAAEAPAPPSKPNYPRPLTSMPLLPFAAPAKDPVRHPPSYS